MTDSPRAATDASFPIDGTPEDRLETLLNWAVLAPSVLNTQPWRFSIEDGAILVFADRSRHLAHIDPEGRELAVSCGAALYNLRLAARHFGFQVEVERMPDPEQPGLLAQLRLGEPLAPTDAEESLFRAIKHRHTNRHPFADTPLPAGLTRFLQYAASGEGAHLVVAEAEAEKAEIAGIIGEGVRMQADDPDMSEEIHHWLRPTKDPRRDGVSDSVQAGWDRVSFLRSDSRRFAAQIERLAASSPALFCLATDTDTPEAWVRAGEALQHVLLAASLYEVSASYLNQPVEVAPMRQKLAEVVGAPHPQVLFRVGFAASAEGTPRRSVADVIA